MKEHYGVVSFMLWPLTPGEKAAGWEPGVNGLGSMGYGRDFGSSQLRISQSTDLLLQSLSHTASQVQARQDNRFSTPP